MNGNTLMKKAKEAIEQVFADMSVDQRTAIDRLEQLRDELEIRIEAIYADLERAENNL